MKTDECRQAILALACLMILAWLAASYTHPDHQEEKTQQEQVGEYSCPTPQLKSFRMGLSQDQLPFNRKSIP